MPNVIRLALFSASTIVVLAMSPATTIVTGQGENMDYLPFSKSLLRKFELTRIEMPGDLRSGKPISVSGVQIQEEKAAGVDDPNADSIHRIVFSGRNRRGKAWSVGATAGSFYQALYQGDLDRNGERDLVLALNTGGNGLAPSTRLIFVSFDRQGDPTLLEATGYYQIGPTGIPDLADLDGDRRAELVHMVFDQGYWITNVYRLRESRWSLVRGRFAGFSFPLYTRFTNRPNHTPVRPARGRHPVAPNLLDRKP